MTAKESLTTGFWKWVGKMIDILIVEDNEELCGLLCDFLRAENYTVSTAPTAEKALSLFEKYGARLVLLDINLPELDGFSVCKTIREKDNTPIIILTARTDKEDKLNGILLGADDYIEKPYDIDILIAKIKGIFRRRLAMDIISDGDITLNLADNTAVKNGSPLNLTAKEFELLHLLIANKGQTLTKDFIFGRIWGSDSESEPQTLTVQHKMAKTEDRERPEKSRKNTYCLGQGLPLGGLI